MDPARNHDESSLASALTHAIDAGHRLVIDRIDLARVDILELVGRAQDAGVMVVLGSMMAMVGWIFLTGAAVLWLQPYLTLPVSAAVVGVASLVIGGALVAAGARYARRSVRHNGTSNNNAGERSARRWGVTDGYDRV